MLNELSNQMADAVAATAPSVVQVQGRRRPASGVVYAEGVVVTLVRTLGREDGLRVRSHEGHELEAELAGWDPATSLAVLRVAGLKAPSLRASDDPVRVGHLALAIARSWSNNVTASAGIVSVIGGPLRTGRRRTIDQVIRTTAPMHDGFAGGAFLDTRAGLIGISTSTTIRGLGVIIPSAIAWKTVAAILEHGSLKRGYLGIAGQAVALAAPQRTVAGQDHGLLIVGVTSDGPASNGGVLVGDVLLALDGHGVDSPEDLLDQLTGARRGATAALKLLRGTDVRDVAVTVGERPAR